MIATVQLIINVIIFVKYALINFNVNTVQDIHFHLTYRTAKIFIFVIKNNMNVIINVRIKVVWIIVCMHWDIKILLIIDVLIHISVKKSADIAWTPVLANSLINMKFINVLKKIVLSSVFCVAMLVVAPMLMMILLNKSMTKKFLVS